MRDNVDLNVSDCCPDLSGGPIAIARALICLVCACAVCDLAKRGKNN